MLKTLMLMLVMVAVPMVAVGDEKPSADAEEKIKPGPPDSQEKEKPGKIDKDAPKEFTKTNTGLKYRILRKSDKKKPTRDNEVTVHYKGWLNNKIIFDSSYRRGEKISFGLGQVIPGWTEGMQLVGVDGMIELEIPPHLGYGAQGAGRAVPPNATLHFIVELFDIN